MSKTKELDRLATETAEECIKDIYRACDWALDGKDLDHRMEGDEFNELHSFLMKSVVRKIANKLNVTTNQYYDE